MSHGSWVRPQRGEGGQGRKACWKCNLPWRAQTMATTCSYFTSRRIGMAPSEMHKCSCARTQGAHRANCHVCVLMPHHRAGEADGCIHDFHLTTMPCTCPKPKQDPAARIELATFWLQARCSATKLNRLLLEVENKHTISLKLPEMFGLWLFQVLHIIQQPSG